MKKLIVMKNATVLTATILLMAASVFGTDFAGGSGTESDPYLISTPEHLQLLSDEWGTYQYDHFKMVRDIDLAGTSLASIEYFRGVFDGNGRTIYNYKATNPCSDDMVGLFVKLWFGGKIKNLTLVNPFTQCLTSYSGASVGSLVGRLSSGEVTNCHVINTV